MNKIIEGNFSSVAEKLSNAALNEYKAWDYGKKKENNATDIIQRYTRVVKGISSPSEPWSAVFISYLMLNADPNFPISASHYGYATSALKGEAGYELFPLGKESDLSIKAEIGDILIEPRYPKVNPKYTDSHGDVIYKIENNIASLIGGNISNTVKIFDINLTASNGYFDKNIDVRNKQILIKRTGNKYYNGATLTDKNEIISTLTTTKISNEESKRNIIKIIDILRSKGYSKNIVAAILGNIHKETGGTFNPTASTIDVNNKQSYGLLQFNSGSYDLHTVGSTVDSQILTMINTNKFTSFLNTVKSDSDTTPYRTAFTFARLFEGCVGCKTMSAYKSNTEFRPYERSVLAEEYFKRLNDPSDELFWK